MTKVFIVLYHNRWEHSECEVDCCCAQTTEIKGVAMTRPLAEGLINKLIQRCGNEREEFVVQEEEVIE